MKRSVEFDFAPGDPVLLTAYGLNYRGRVLICEARANRGATYVIEYVNDGAKIETGTFWGDQLKDRPWSDGER